MIDQKFKVKLFNAPELRFRNKAKISFLIVKSDLREKKQRIKDFLMKNEISIMSY